MQSRLDPIGAVATAGGRGAVGIVRLSGEGLAPLAAALCGGLPEPRVATLATWHDVAGAAIDRGLALWFPAPHSYTGEDVLELQAHGGPVVLELLLARCLELARAVDADGAPCLPALVHLRRARPGEFTERAFLNDKLDLAQAEAVADLIDASTAQAARSAARSLEGALSHEADALAEALVALRVLVEATLDFPEEEIEFLERARARERLVDIRDRIGAALATARHGRLLRDGLVVVLAGQPNVGKSSLLNALAGAELAIVTPIAGTTRDRVAETLAVDGVPLRVVDTAGLRELAGTRGDAGLPAAALDAVEAIGIERSWQAIREADVVLFVHDLTRRAETEGGDARIAARLAEAGLAARVLHVWNKVDAAEGLAEGAPEAGVAVSASTGQGLAGLRAALLQRVGHVPGAEGVFIARERHLDALRRAGTHVDAALALAARGDAALELLAEELRAAHEALGEISGRMTADDLLGAIFARFCIGK